MTTVLYDTDFYSWALQQAELLRNEDYADLDIDNLVEEIEAMAKRDRRELLNRLKVILIHLLKWKYQPSHRSKSWTDTLDEQRDEIDTLLDDSPSLRREVPDLIVKAYPKAVAKAAKETSLSPDLFPSRCEWTVEQLLDLNYLP
ncbi:MAG: DUF29 domain-containing protein [Caldilineaceae bacterium]